MADIDELLFKLLLTEIHEMNPVQRAGYYSVITQFVGYATNNIAGGKRTKNKKRKQTKRRKNKTKRGGRYSNYPMGINQKQNAIIALDEIESEEETQPGSFWGVYNTPTLHLARARALRAELNASADGSQEQDFIIRRISNMHRLLKNAQDSAVALRRFRQTTTTSSISLLIGGFISLYCSSVQRAYEDRNTFSYLRDQTVDTLTWSLLLVPDLLTFGFFNIRNFGTHFVEGRSVGYNHLALVMCLPPAYNGATRILENILFADITPENLERKLTEFDASLRAEGVTIEAASARAFATAQRVSDRSDDRANAVATVAGLGLAAAFGLPQAAFMAVLQNTPPALIGATSLALARTSMSKINGLSPDEQAFYSTQLSEELKEKFRSTKSTVNSAIPPKIKTELKVLNSWEEDYASRMGDCLKSFESEGGKFDDTVALEEYIDEHLDKSMSPGSARAPGFARASEGFASKGFTRGPGVARAPGFARASEGFASPGFTRAPGFERESEGFARAPGFERSSEGFARAPGFERESEGFARAPGFAQDDRLRRARETAAHHNVGINVQRGFLYPDAIDYKKDAFNNLAQREDWRWICHNCSFKNYSNNLTCQNCGASFLESNSIYVPNPNRMGDGNVLYLE